MSSIEILMNISKCYIEISSVAEEKKNQQEVYYFFILLSETGKLEQRSTVVYENQNYIVLN